jgi:hypothetical protein
MASDISAGSQQTGNEQTAELADRARTVLVVCGNAHDAQDAALLLEALAVDDRDALGTAKTLAELDRRAAR